MVKIKKINIHQPLVVTGYILFILLIVAVFLSTTIPFGTILFQPTSRKLNVTILMVSLTIGAILPVLIGYWAGDRSVKSKGKLSHHFNGVLFGLLAYWIMTLFVVFVPIQLLPFADQNTRLVFMNVLPSIGVGVVTIALAIAHVRSTKAGRDLLEYTPFSIVLIASIIALPVVSLFSNVVTNSITSYSFVPLSIVVIIGLLSYLSLTKDQLTVFTRSTWAAISLSVLFVAMYISYILESAVSGYLVPYPTMESQTIGSVIATVLALTGWLVYWALQAKALRNGNR